MNDKGNIKVIEHLVIKDAFTKEVILNKRVSNQRDERNGSK
jgi:hypothetical protein